MPIIPHGLRNEVREELTGRVWQLCEQFEPEKMLLFGSYTLLGPNLWRTRTVVMLTVPRISEE
jgi:hypothetical protein